MNLFLVIFGAGASYDSVQLRGPVTTEQDRPPLATELFDPDRRSFVEAAYEWREGAGLIGEIRSSVAGGTGDETALERFVGYASAGAPETIRGLLAIRYYIRQVITQCARDWSRKYGNVTNHRMLFNQIERWRRGHQDQGLLVTFNYDWLLDAALESSGRSLDSIDAFVSRDDYRLIKAHGSIDWMRDLGNLNAQSPHAIIDLAPEIDFTSGKIVTGSVNGITSAVPAIAIPTQTKTTFECPPEHIEALEDWLPEVDRILIIGWRAQERHFLDMCKRHLAANPDVEVLVVSESPESARPTISALTEHLPAACMHPSVSAGFSRFAASDKAVEIWLDRRLHTRLSKDDPEHNMVLLN
jgi:SIR2-like domain